MQKMGKKKVDHQGLTMTSSSSFLFFFFFCSRAIHQTGKPAMDGRGRAVSAPPETTSPNSVARISKPRRKSFAHTEKEVVTTGESLSVVPCRVILTSIFFFRPNTSGLGSESRSYQSDCSSKSESSNCFPTSRRSIGPRGNQHWSIIRRQ